MDREDASMRDERSLVEAARTDPMAFSELYRRHVHAIHRFALRRTGSAHAADDITSATFERALAKLHRFRWRPPGIRPWLFRIASNEIAEHHRSTARHGTDRAQAVLGRWAAAPQTDPLDAVDDADDRTRLLDAIDQLRPRYRRVIELRYFADLDQEAAAAAAGTSPATFAVVLHRARTALRKILEEDRS